MINKHIQLILDNGYTIIRNGFTKEKACDLKNELKLIQKSWKSPEQGIPFLNQSTPLIYNPDHKSLKILLFLLRENPLLHDLFFHFLNDKWYRRLPVDEPNYILRAAIARSSADNSLPLHIDSFIPSSGSNIFVMQALFALDKSNDNNGSTIVVPGSHKSDEYATQDAIKNAISLDLCPGDIALWDSRLWHGAQANISGNDRWSIIATFTRWWIKQNYQTPNALPKDFVDSLEPHELTIMGFNSFPPLNEYERVDIKKGHVIN